MQRETMIEVYKTTQKLSNECTKAGTATEKETRGAESSAR